MRAERLVSCIDTGGQTGYLPRPTAKTVARESTAAKKDEERTRARRSTVTEFPNLSTRFEGSFLDSGEYEANICGVGSLRQTGDRSVRSSRRLDEGTY